MDYLTVQETAALKGCSDRYIKKLCKEGKLQCSIEINERNRPKYMIAVSSLPNALQAQYYLQINKTYANDVIMPLKQPEKAVKRSFEEFTAVERQQILLWRSVVEDWRRYREQYPGNKTDVDKLYISKLQLEKPELKISKDILYRKYKAYKENDLQGLCDNRGGWNKGRSGIPKEIWDEFLYLYLSENKPTVSRCYELTKTWTAINYPDAVADFASEQSFRRRIKSEIPQAVLIYMRDGDKAMKDKCLPYINRMYDKLHANDVWIADNHTLDIQSYNTDDGMIHRLYLTAFLDAKSGVLVGWNICDSPNSQSTIIALRHGIMRFGIPRAVYFDNGREFLTHDVGGKGHRTRKSDNEELEPPTILQRLGIDMHNAIVRNAKAKPIERTFSTVTMQFARMFEGYCGGTIMQRPESLQRRIKDGKLPCDFEVRELLEDWIDGDYNVQQYGGSESTFKGMSRIETWNKDIQSVGVRKAVEADLNLMLMRSTRLQKIKRNGVFVNIAGEKLWFYDPESTYRHLDDEVYVRYDPADLRQVRIYDKYDKYLWTWECADKLLIDYITESKEEISDAMALQRRTQRYIKMEAKNITDGLNNDRKLDMYGAAALQAANGKSAFKIIMPTNVIVMRADEEQEAVYQKAAGDSVVIDLAKMNRNIEKRKEE